MLNDDQLKTLRHMLGLTRPERGDQVPYRDYYCANPGDVRLIELEQLGVVKKYAERDGYWWYCTTAAGKRAALASALSRRLSKAQRMYRLFLNISDRFPDLSFHQFLVDREFADARRRA